MDGKCEWCGIEDATSESACLADPETGEGPLSICDECARIDRELQERRALHPVFGL